MQIRKIKPQHAKELIELSQQNFGDESWTEKQLADIITDDNYICIALIEDEKMLSYLIAVQSLDDVNIVSIATKEGHKNKGYATKLIKWMIALCQYVEKTLSLEVKSKNITAINLYQNLGFEKVHERKNYYRDGDTALIMFHVTKDSQKA